MQTFQIEQLQSEVIVLSDWIYSSVRPEGITIEIFTDMRSRKIYEFLDSGLDPTPSTLEAFGIGPEYYCKVAEYSPTTSNTEYHIQRLKKLCARRQKHSESLEKIRRLEDPLDDCSDIIEGFSNGLVTRTIKEMEEHFRSSNGGERIDFHYAPFDNLVQNITTGSFWVHVARAGTGKTNLGFSLGHRLARYGTPSLMFSTELIERQAYRRYASMVAFEKGKTPVMPYDKEYALSMTEDLPSDWPFRFCFESEPSVRDVRETIREHKHKYGTRFFIIDHLHRLPSEKSDRRDALSTLARQYKNIAKTLDVMILMLAQPKRSGVPNDDGFSELCMQDLKESGDIENECDLITGSWKVTRRFDEAIRKRYLIVEDLKQRDGPFVGRQVINVLGVWFKELSQSDQSEILEQDDDERKKIRHKK